MKPSKEKLFLCVLGLGILLGLGTLTAKTDLLCRSVSDKVFRLHILAESNDPYDQETKLMVRDTLLKTASIPETKEEQMTSQALLNQSETAANEILKQRGSESKAEAKTERIFFPKRVYGEYTFPAGEYDALRIVLGEGEGENWWCVLYPSLCIPAASDEGEKLFTDEELSMLKEEPDYVFSLYIRELWLKIKAFFDKENGS